MFRAMQQWIPAPPASQPGASSLAAEPADPLAFTPVPRKYRYDGWTAERQRAFIAALAETGSVTAAARRINMASEGAYALRRARGAESFAAAWEAALASGVQRLTDIALERAIEGVPVPVFHKGEQVGERRWYNDRLLMFVLKHHQPDRYGKPAALPPGTKHPDTIAHEAAGDGCPACRERAKEDARKAAIEAEAAKRDKLEFVENLLRTYKLKVLSERRSRLEGDVAAADLYVRQLTFFELILDGCGKRPDIIDLHTTRPGEHGLAMYAVAVNAGPLTAILDKVRRKAWEEAGDPPRPPIDLRETCVEDGYMSGPTLLERERARNEAQRVIARGQAMWEACATEETWSRFKELGDA